MYAKFIIFGFLAIFAVQGVVEAKTVAHPIQRNVIDDLGKLLQNLKEYVANGIKAAVEKVKSLVANMKNFVANLIENAKVKLQEEVLKILGIIGHLQEEAEILGIDVTECIAAHQQEIEKFKNIFMAEVIACASEQIEQAQTMVDIIISEIKDVMSFVSSIQDKAKKCGMNVVCYGSLIKEAYNLFAELPGKIQQLAFKAVNLVTSIKSEVPKCLSSKILKFVTAAGPVVLVIGKCIAEKIGHLYY